LGGRQPLIKNPVKVLVALSFLQTAPHVVIVAAFPDRSLVYGALSGNFFEVLAQFSYIYSAGLAASVFGIYAGKRAVGEQRNFERAFFTTAHVRLIVFVLLVLYISLMVAILQSAGGLFHFLANIAARASMLAGTGIYFVFSSPAAYLLIFYAVYGYAKAGKISIYGVFFIIIMSVALEATLGGRRQPLQMIIFSIFAFGVYRGRSNLLSVGNLFLIALAIIIFAGLLLVRFDEGTSVDPVDILLNFSHNDIYLYIIQRFSEAPYWHGAAFLDLVYRLTEDSAAAPPIDEGVYVYNLFLGFDYKPPTPMSSMVWNSWPPGSFGNGYMNFGPAGVILFQFARGIVVGFLFKMAANRNFSPSFFCAYLWVVFGFQISNLKITQFLMLVVGLLCLNLLLRTLEKKSIKGAKV
jgi:oligosaccharide repeat unit polymerase